MGRERREVHTAVSKPRDTSPRMFIYCRDPIHEMPRHNRCRSCQGKELIEVQYQEIKA